jgi:hypothetical protein
MPNIPISLLTTSISLAIAAVTCASAQERPPAASDWIGNGWSIGPDIGITGTWHSNAASIARITWFEPAGAPAEPSGTDYVFGLSLRGRISEGLAIAYRLTYSEWTAHATAKGHAVLSIERYRGEDPDSIASDTAARRVPVTVETELSYPMISLATLAMFRVARLGRGSLDIAIGPAVSLVLETRERVTMRLDETVQGRFRNPQGYPVENDARVMHLYDGEIPEKEGMRVGFLGGLGSRHPMSGRLELTTLLLVDFPLTSIVANGTWRAIGLSGSIGVQMRL